MSSRASTLSPPRASGPLLLACLLFMCDPPPEASDAGAPPTSDAGAPAPAEALADYASGDLWDAPWPDERMRRDDGGIALSGFPNPLRARIVDDLTSVLDGAEGFAVSGTIFFPLSAPIDEGSLPDVHQSTGGDATVFLVDVDPDGAPGTRAPIEVRFLPDGGPNAVRNVLALQPLQGRPLAANRMYAAVVTTGVRTALDTPLGVAASTAGLVEGDPPAGLPAAAATAHADALDALRAAGVDDGSIAAMAVFRTWDPTAGLRAAQAQLAADAPPAAESDFTAAEVFDDYCVFRTTLTMPDFQSGEAPYLTEGGTWTRDAGGQLVEQRAATANVWVTLPRGAMPAEGFPTAVFVRTGGGGDRPLIDRGPRAEPGGASIAEGTGPALPFARAGWAGLMVDGPLGGLRNTDGWDEQFAIFNINNIAGLRDNVRQSALELIHLARFVPTVAIDASSCPGLTTPGGDSVVTLDDGQLAIMGHSMGATIAPLAVALEPAYRATILSGAGGSWIRNVIYKESPVAVRPAAENLLRYTARGLTLHAFDPALTLLQWAGEPADPQVYPMVDDRHVLMFQGILDTYIPPPVANPLSLALELDQAGDALDETLADRFTPLGDLIDLSGGEHIALPASGNADGATRVVVQHLEDGVEDGHEIVFQRPEPQLQYRCFLQTMRAGAPRVPASDATGCE